jgi:hypothetical protein
MTTGVIGFESRLLSDFSPLIAGRESSHEDFLDFAKENTNSLSLRKKRTTLGTNSSLKSGARLSWINEIKWGNS